MRLLIVVGLILSRTGCHGSSPALPQARLNRPSVSSAPDDLLRDLTRKVLDAANRERRLAGLPELVWDDAAADEARRQSTNMMERGFFSHADPVRGPLSTRLNSAGIKWSRCGENLFRERGMDDPPDAAVESWMKSAGHRAVLLDPVLSQSGVGIAISPDTEYFITEIFVRPAK